MKLDVHQVAEATKLKTDQIRALEQGDYESFSAAVYLRGSLRTYATLLKLDVAGLMAQLEAELGAGGKSGAAPAVSGRKPGGVDVLMLFLSRNWGILAAVVVIALLALAGTAAYRAWNARKTYDPFKEIGSGTYQQAQPSGEILPLPTNAPRRAP